MAITYYKSSSGSNNSKRGVDNHSIAKKAEALNLSAVAAAQKSTIPIVVMMLLFAVTNCGKKSTVLSFDCIRRTVASNQRSKALYSSTTATSTATECLARGSLASQLKNPSLLDFSINNDSDDNSTYKVYDPSSQNVVGIVPSTTVDETRQYIDKAHDALPAWRDQTTAAHRASCLREWSRLIQENADDIAAIMTYEAGKTLTESSGEVAYGVSFLDYFAAEASRPTSAGGGFITPSPFSDSNTGAPRGKVMAIHQAVGVVALLAPWNFPLAMITRKAAPALAVGCTAIIKPSNKTPLTALAAQTLAYQAGIPQGVLRIVTPEESKEVGDLLCQDDRIRKLSFTGSTAVGKSLMKSCSDTMKRLSLELGGNAPFVVFGDADLDVAVQATMSSKFRNAGQTCVCADRFLVHASIHDEYVEKLKQEMSKSLIVGIGSDEKTTMGPLITSSAVESVDEKVQDAVQNHGATIVTGGHALPDIGPNFYAPTILTNVDPKNAAIWKQETFGPVVAIVKFDTDEEALQLANDCEVGLASYFCTTDMKRAFSFAEQLETGIVGVNEGVVSTVVAPFGGVKESGVGREGSAMGLAEYLETKYIFLNV